MISCEKSVIKVIEQLKEKYCLEIDKIVKNEDSTDGNVYMLFNDTTKYILKLYDDKNHAISMINIHKDLRKNGMNVPKIILNKENNGYTSLDDGKYCVIYSFLDGDEIGNLFKNINAEVSSKIAKEIKKIHKITSGDNKYDLKSLPFNIEKKFNRYSTLHFDLTRCNIFYNEDWSSKIGFIDFDDAKYGPTIVDVAITISLLYFSKSRGVDIEGLKAFLDEYYESDELRKEEVPYLKECAIKWIDYIMDNNQFDTSTTESFEIRKNLIETEMNF